MSFKKWLQGEEPSDYTSDELITLERFDEAKQLLMTRLKHAPNDLHAHLKLAEVYRHQGQADSCKSEFMFVAGAYADDGFYDRARAVLVKVSRLFPGEIDVEQKMAALQRAKRLDHSREKARAGLLSHSRLEDTMTGVRAIEFERIWNQLSQTSLVDQVSTQDFTRLFESVQIRRLSPGEVLVEPGPEPERLFILVKGILEARADDKNGHQIALRSFAAGDIVGDTVIFEHRSWAAEYRCDEDAVLLELDRKGLERLLAGHGDPRRLLDVLRSQDNDNTVVRAVRHLRR